MVEDDPDPQRFQELMIDGEPDFESLLECVFGITDSVAEVYVTLLDHPESSTKELAKEMDYDRSNLNRKLNALCDRGLVSRKRNSLSVGGFSYKYEAVPIDQTQERMHRTLDEWTAFMHEKIDTVDGDHLGEHSMDAQLESKITEVSNIDNHGLIHGYLSFSER